MLHSYPKTKIIFLFCTTNSEVGRVAVSGHCPLPWTYCDVTEQRRFDNFVVKEDAFVDYVTTFSIHMLKAQTQTHVAGILHYS